MVSIHRTNSMSVVRVCVFRNLLELLHMGLPVHQPCQKLNGCIRFHPNHIFWHNPHRSEISLVRPCTEIGKAHTSAFFQSRHSLRTGRHLPPVSFTAQASANGDSARQDRTECGSLFSAGSNMHYEMHKAPSYMMFGLACRIRIVSIGVGRDVNRLFIADAVDNLDGEINITVEGLAQISIAILARKIAQSFLFVVYRLEVY